MKRIILSITLCLAVTLAFSQKKNVKAAKDEIDASKPNFTEAKAQIKAAMTDPETKDNPETWYVGGCVDDKIFSTENNKILLKQKPNEKMMYEALVESYDYFTKAVDLEKIPNEKGKISDKYTKQIKSILKVNYPYYINAGAYFYKEKNYPEAYKAFNTYLEIPKTELFSGEKMGEDSTYHQIMFYAAFSAQSSGDTLRCIQLLEELKPTGYDQEIVYSALADEYKNAKDTVNFFNTLKEGSKLFPKNLFFIQNLINISLNTNRTDEVFQYLDEAIAQDPQEPQYWRIKGDLYESKKEIDKALNAYQEALKINPDYSSAIGAIGRLYYNQGFDIQSKANELDIRQSKIEVEKAKELYKKALPYLEKAHEMDKTDKQYIMALYGAYYALGDPRMEQMEKLLEGK